MNKTTWESTVKPVVVLSVISLVVSLLLAVVNSMTAPVIAENERATTLAAYVDVMPLFPTRAPGRDERLHHRKRLRCCQG